MLLTLFISLFFCLVSLAAPTMPGFKEYNITLSDGTTATVNIHESFVPDPKVAAAPPAPTSAAGVDPDRSIITFTSDHTVGRLCKLKERKCTTTEASAIWDNCLHLKTFYEAHPGYWDVSQFQERNLYSILGYYSTCYISLARDDDYINDGAQLSTQDVTSWMKNTGRSCGVVGVGNVIHVGATVSLDCPNTDTEDVTARLKLWIHSPAGARLSSRTEDVSMPKEEDASLPESDALPRDFNAVFVPTVGAAPFCTLGWHECGGEYNSPRWEDCEDLKDLIDSTPGYWDLSLWADQNAYGLLIFMESCQIYVSRDDGNWTLPSR
ncbi:hypothetical protein PG988_002296 [Apiospora saccharicola]